MEVWRRHFSHTANGSVTTSLKNPSLDSSTPPTSCSGSLRPTFGAASTERKFLSCESSSAPTRRPCLGSSVPCPTSRSSQIRGAVLSVRIWIRSKSVPYGRGERKSVTHERVETSPTLQFFNAQFDCSYYIFSLQPELLPFLFLCLFISLLLHSSSLFSCATST